MNQDISAGLARGKSGRKLSEPNLPPPFRGGLNWDKIRDERARRLEAEYERGVRNPDTVLHHDLDDEGQRQAAIIVVNERITGKRQVGPGDSRPVRPRVTPEQTAQMIEMYKEGKTPNNIGVTLGVAGQTVITHLTKAGVYDRERDRRKGRPVTAGKNPPPAPPNKDKEVCVRGHDLLNPDNVRHETQVKNGKLIRKRSCRPCDKIRKQEAYKKLQEKRC